ncbi:hypothetical protein [Paenibacillus hexagrammi]|uniref:Uncharacterized protein n=1 Tax=Paenibacillus hexagrammi TaxID=2908839 RepID=A0ABY3SRQ1_9BACL|nr:hypothetical protein [Paenibacillus sp. YPD9-1]UJF36090.1 hypothetical protein L0M14_14045 [Paenibacillus sp. YPD9-1]
MLVHKSLMLGGLVVMLSLSGCQADGLFEKDSQWISSASYGSSTHVADHKDKLYRFITGRLSGSYGIYTNLQETGQSGEAASGHEVLSESAGVMMRYYALNGEQTKFDSEWALAKSTFNMNTGFSYRYSPLLHKHYTLNAAVDDLRIIRALYEADKAFQTDKYKAEFESFAARLYTYNVKDGYLYDFYDETYHTLNSFITLCYVDLKTLETLPIPTNKKDELVNKMTGIVTSGYLSDEFLFIKHGMIIILNPINPKTSIPWNPC